MSARDLFERYKVALNQRDFDLVEPLLSTQCQFWFTSGTFEGLADVRRAVEKTWGLIQDEVYDVVDVHWLAESESAAVCTYTFKWQGTIDGQACSGRGRGTSCFRLEPDGWKIVHEHLSHFPS
ncbi:MAG TPA: nuclear transport factor 2 family protein [Oscillatoriaceae cyanobacterium]